MDKKVILGIAGAVVAAGLLVWHFHNQAPPAPTCHAALQEEVALLQGACIVDIKEEINADREAFHNNLCKAAGKEVGCQLDRDTDLGAVNGWLQARFQRCLDAKYAEMNICPERK